MIRYDLGSVSNFRLFGFATGNYTCKCVECGIDFIGDKRSSQCLGCAIQYAQKTPHNNEYTAPQATPKSCPKCKGTLIGSRPSTGKNHCRLCNHEWA